MQQQDSKPSMAAPAKSPMQGSTSSIEPNVQSPHKSVDMLLQNAADGKYGPEAQALGQKAIAEEAHEQEAGEEMPERGTSPFSDEEAPQDEEQPAPQGRAAMFSRGGM